MLAHPPERPANFLDAKPTRVARRRHPRNHYAAIPCEDSGLCVRLAPCEFDTRQPCGPIGP